MAGTSAEIGAREAGEVRSPITGTTDVTLLREFACAEIAAQYRKSFDLDISALLRGHDSLVLYRCNASGYRFYAPSDVIGDSAFYHHLEQSDWYYMPGKWEFSAALAFLHRHANVLEIGAAKGDFLIQLRDHFGGDVSCTGLELNAEAARTAKARGVNVLLESHSEHARGHPRAYDAVAAFQVLEHMPDPMRLLEDALAMLAPGGRLIVGVPDNSARPAESIFNSVDTPLNMPPHHQGLWDICSLSFLPKVLPVKLAHVAVEPATAGHLSNSYRELMKADLLARFGPVVGFLAYALGRPFYNHALRHLNPHLPAHTLLAVFEKLPDDTV